MELDHQFTKNKTEDNLVSVIASLMQKLYDKMCLQQSLIIVCWGCRCACEE